MAGLVVTEAYIYHNSFIVYEGYKDQEMPWIIQMHWTGFDLLKEDNSHHGMQLPDCQLWQIMMIFYFGS
ncbi:MAG: hypothetical protein U5K79_14180 [Cyclobacteriaceae bacterium]|nr:hypothetical protein [Cyclobacteriaceae bacterium]